VHCFSPNLEGTLFAGTDSGRVLASTDMGNSWTPRQIGSAEKPVRALAVDGTSIIAGTGGDGIFVSTDDGMNWNAVNDGLANRDITALTVYVDLEGDTVLLAGTSDGVYRSTNDGATWIHAGLSWSTVGPFVEVRPDIYTVVCAGGELGGCGITKSTNAGRDWENVSMGLPYGGAAISCITTMEQTMFLAENAGHRVYRRYAGDSAWRPVAFAIIDINALASAVFFDLTDHFLFAGTDDLGVVYSLDWGESWRDMNDGMPLNTKVTSLAFHDGYLVAGTGWGIWRRWIPDLVTRIPAPDHGQGDFALMQNYPNPFNPSTTIRYGLSTRSQVTLTVFNSLGQRVALLENGEREAGYHEVQLNAAGLPSGVYFYRLQAGMFTDVKRLVVMK
jgi:hypothetical protein